jgi:hypothetical protein
LERDTGYTQIVLLREGKGKEEVPHARSMSLRKNTKVPDHLPARKFDVPRAGRFSWPRKRMKYPFSRKKLSPRSKPSLERARGKAGRNRNRHLVR